MLNIVNKKLFIKIVYDTINLVEKYFSHYGYIVMLQTIFIPSAIK